MYAGPCSDSNSIAYPFTDMDSCSPDGDGNTLTNTDRYADPSRSKF